jgi:predicted porin
MTFNRTPAVLTLIFGSVVSLRAQQSAIQQLQNIQQAQQQKNLLPAALSAGTNAPELYTGENLDVGPQRILRLNPRPNYFDVLFDSQVFYSDNANYSQAPFMVGSTVYVNTAQAAFAPPAWNLGPGKFSLAAGLASQWYNYGNEDLTSLDFDAQTVFTDGKYTLGNWQFNLGASYTRLVNQSDYGHETYREFLPEIGAQRVFPINDNLLFAVGDQLEYHFTKVPTEITGRPDINDRLDDTLYLTLSWQIVHNLILQPYYRFQYSHYQRNTLQDGDRNDFLHTFGVTLVYYFNKDISMRTFLNYNRKQTDDPLTPQYHEFEGGIGAALEFKF